MSCSYVIAVFADKHGMNLIISNGKVDLKYTLYRLYKNHWIELQEVKLIDAFEILATTVMPDYMPLVISGRFFLFGESLLDAE
jgi:hypothetical protein